MGLGPSQRMCQASGLPGNGSALPRLLIRSYWLLGWIVIGSLDHPRSHAPAYALASRPIGSFWRAGLTRSCKSTISPPRHRRWG